MPNWWSTPKRGGTNPAARPNPARGPEPTGYNAKREKENARNKQRSENARNIGQPPAVTEPDRRARAEADPLFFLKTYFPQTFTLPFAQCHREVIALAEQITIAGGLQAVAMPRGSGKTAIFERMALRAVLFGRRRFVVLIGANADAAQESMATLQAELLNNELLAADFPEVCHPFRKIDGIANRAKGQHIDGRPTRCKWAANELVFPTVNGSKASGAVLIARGILSRLRGMKRKTAEGEELRPDLVIPDDPQTDHSARSPYQVTKRLKVLRGTILGMAGPAKKIAAFCPCTVIETGDLADQLLNRETAPEWHGQKIPLLVSLPTDRQLWEQYHELRADEMRRNADHSESNRFYREHREAMDAGAVPTWPERFDAGELSAIQHAQNLIQDRGRETFDAEFQQTPHASTSADVSSWFRPMEEIAAKIWTPPRGEHAPTWAEKILAFVDVQQRLLYYGTAAFGPGFRMHIIELSTWPDQPNPFFHYGNARRTIATEFPRAGIAGGLTAALQKLLAILQAKRYRTGTHEGLPIAAVGIDTGWKNQIVHAVAREWPQTGWIQPAKGQGVAAHNKPLSEYNDGPGERSGANWRHTPAKKFGSTLLTIDTNHWKTRLHMGLATPYGDPEAITLPGDRLDWNPSAAAHFHAERPIETTGHGRTVFDWQHLPSKPDNHWFDVATGLMALASYHGIETPDEQRPKRKPAHTISAEDIAEYNRQARRFRR